MSDEHWIQAFYDHRQEAPKQASRRPKRRGRPEKAIQKQIALWLQKKGVLLAITDAGLLYGATTGIPEGWPDITGCLPSGRFLGVECKAPDGVQSETQKEAERRIRVRTGVYILARSIDEVKKGLLGCEVVGVNTGIPLDELRQIE